jgi:hypothetical protein
MKQQQQTTKMNAEFLSGLWQDPVLHMVLLQKLETYPPFGAMRDTNIDNVTAAVNRSAAGKLSAPLTRAQVEDRIDRIVATRHGAFANVDASDFTHPDFSRLAALDAADSNNNNNVNNNINNRNEQSDAKRPVAALATPSSAKSKRARSTASDADTSTTTTTNNTTNGVALDVVDSGGNVATAALLRDANLVKRVRKFERSWRRYLGGEEKLKEFAKLIYGAIATNKARVESTDNIVAFFRDNFRSALTPSDVTRFEAKSTDDVRDMVIKALEKNSIFFLQDAAGDTDGANVGAQQWTVGDLAPLKLEQQSATEADDQD